MPNTVHILYGDIFVSENVVDLNRHDKERLCTTVPGLNFPVAKDHVISFGRRSHTFEAADADAGWVHKSLCIFTRDDTLPVGWESDAIIQRERSIIMMEGSDIYLLHKDVANTCVLLMRRGGPCYEAEHIQLRLMAKGMASYI